MRPNELYVYFPFTETFSREDAQKNLHAIMEHGAKPQSCQGTATSDFFNSLTQPQRYLYFFTIYDTMRDLMNMSEPEDEGLHGLVFEIYLDQSCYQLAGTLVALRQRLNDANDPLENGRAIRRDLIMEAIEGTPSRRTVSGFDGAYLHPQNIT